MRHGLTRGRTILNCEGERVSVEMVLYRAGNQLCSFPQIGYLFWGQVSKTGGNSSAKNEAMALEMRGKKG